MSLREGTPTHIVQRSEFPPELKYNVRYTGSAFPEQEECFPNGFMLRRCQGAVVSDEDFHVIVPPP